MDTDMINTPFHKLTPRAIRVWQLGNAFGNLFLFALPGAYAAIFGYQRFHFWIVLTVTVLLLTYWILSVAYIPYLSWKKWRYAIDENEIDLARGVIIHKRTLIPLSRVQHVDTRQGPILRWYKLATVTISTAATTHEIPALDEMIADRVRSQISTYARLAEDDV
jgi:membrane protein YdbS with pleckstrin-like domain